MLKVHRYKKLFFFGFVPFMNHKNYFVCLEMNYKIIYMQGNVIYAIRAVWMKFFFSMIRLLVIIIMHFTYLKYMICRTVEKISEWINDKTLKYKSNPFKFVFGLFAYLQFSWTNKTWCESIKFSINRCCEKWLIFIDSFVILIVIVFTEFDDSRKKI